MNSLTIPRFLVCSLIPIALAACTEPSAPSPQAVRKTSPATDAVAAIRAAGAGMDSAVQVEPLRNPAVEGLLKKAHQAESAKDYAGAANATASALALAPDSPDILQYQAEIAALRGDWKKAEQLAIKSYTLGPKLGSLCARNWQTVIEARIVFKDKTTQAQARQRLKECRVAPPVRM